VFRHGDIGPPPHGRTGTPRAWRLESMVSVPNFTTTFSVRRVELARPQRQAFDDAAAARRPREARRVYDHARLGRA
jgi:hypothetical protein